MITNESGGPPVRGTAAPRTYPRQEVGRRFDGIPPRRPSVDVTAGDGRYPIDDQREIPFEQALTAARRFEQFHAANPNVYRVLVALAREWVRRTGRLKLGIATLYERARWDLAIVTDDPDYKLNNDHRAYYARLIMRQERDLTGLFDLRRSPEADQWIRGVAS